jgi:hypothetical protein
MIKSIQSLINKVAKQERAIEALSEEKNKPKKRHLNLSKS